MASLNEKVETLTVQLGLTRGAPAAQAIAQALKMLGLEERASNLNLVEQADLCLATLGSTPSSSHECDGAKPDRPPTFHSTFIHVGDN